MRTPLLIIVLIFANLSSSGSGQSTAASALLSASNANEQALLNYYRAVSEHRLLIVDTLIAEDFVVDAATPGAKKGKEGFKDFLVLLNTAFPDLHLEPIEFVTSDNRTVCRYRFTGTHQGRFLNLRPTRKHAAVQGIDEWVFRDGKIVELHSSFDSLGLLVQLGLVPEVK